MVDQYKSTDINILVDRWVKSTYLFVVDCIGVMPDDQQKRFLDSVDTLVLKKELGEDSTAIGIQLDSGKGLGKTAAISWVIMKWLVIYEGCKILTTAPKQDLLRDNLWGEFARWIRYGEEHGNGILTEYIGLQADKVFNTFDEKGTVCLARVSSRTATVSDKEATLQGYHAEYMLLIADEAYGIDDAVFNPLEGTMTGKVNFMILAGNPSKNTGYVAECENKNAHKWVTHRFSGEDSTLVTKGYIANMREKYINNENGYRVNVLGMKPLDEDDSVFRFDKIVECMNLELDESSYKDEPIVLGVDIGMGGDLSAVSVRQGPKIHEVVTRKCMNTEENESFIAKYINTYCPTKVVIDKIGVGRGVYDNMSRDYGHIISACVSSNSSINPMYLNKRAELTMMLADRVNMGAISLPDNDELKNEMCAIKVVKDRPQVTIRSKKDMRSSGISSPNICDSIIYTLDVSDKNVREIRRLQYDHAYQRASEEMTNSWMTA